LAAEFTRVASLSDLPEGGWELFDMVTDRTETTDVSAQNPAVLSRLSSEYDAWKARVGVRTWSDETQYLLN